MKKKQQQAQLILVLIGLLLILVTYFYYPYVNREKLLKNKSVQTDVLETPDIDIIARGNKYLGEWAGDQLGKIGEEKQNYIQEIIKADMEEAGSEDVFRKVKKDFQAASINMDDSEIRNQMEKALLRAKDVFGTSFENVEYNGIYDVNKLFKVRSEKAHILNEDPDIVHMTNMHVILYLNDGRIINITSNKGRYNKVTYDCFFEENVKATDGEITIVSENLDLISSKKIAKVYNNVVLTNKMSELKADIIDYNFETKFYKVSMHSNNKQVEAKLVE